jgi:selenocysteine-specific elongation factor
MPELDHAQVQRGMILSQSESIPPVTMAEAQLRILPSIKGTIPDYLQAHLHIGTASVQTRLALLESASMTAGQMQMVQLRLEKPLPLVPGERFVLRANLPSATSSGLTTIGGGRILATSNVRLRRKRSWTLQFLEARLQAIDDPPRWCEVLLRENNSPLNLKDLCRHCLLPESEMQSILNTLQTQDRLCQTPNGLFLHPDIVQHLSSQILTSLQSFHQAHPARAGMEREPLSTAVNAHPEVFDLAIHTLCQANQVEYNGTVYAQAGWNARLADPDQRLCNQIAEAFRKAGWTGPAPAELAAHLQEPLGRVEKMIRLLQERGLLVRLDERLSIHRDAVAAAQQIALRLFAQKSSFSTMEFRDALGVSRKFAVPLLDHLDRIRFTVRSGNSRTPGLEAKKLARES